MDKISNNYDDEGELSNNHNNVTFDDPDKIFVRLIEFDKLPNARLVSSPPGNDSSFYYPKSFCILNFVRE